MRIRGLLASSLIAMLFGVGLAPAAQASNGLEKNISGIIVEYVAGVSPKASNGSVIGAEVPGNISQLQHLGGSLYTLKLAEPIDLFTAKRFIKRMKLDGRILWAEPDVAVEQASVGVRGFAPIPLTKARAASAPRSLRAQASVTSGKSYLPRVRLSWNAPANRYGAKIVGYRIQYSANGGSYQTLVNNTESRDRVVFVSDGIRAGVNYRFRVRAITDDGDGAQVVGLASSSASATVRTSPKPVFLRTTSLTGPGNVNFVKQSLADRGGYPATQIRYSAIATAADIDAQETTLCNAERCRFPNLLPDTQYTVEVIATNPRGSSNSDDAISIDDFYYPVQWYLNGANGISMPSAWYFSKGANDKVVAVIDTGIKEHDQLTKRLTRNVDGSIYGYDFVSDVNSAADGDERDNDPTDMGGDANGGNSYHGTHVSGIIASEHDFLGTAGISPGVKILPIRALGRDGGTVGDLIAAIQWASGEKLDGIPRNRYPVSVINLSLGAKEPVPCSEGYQSVFDRAYSKGITIVAAAGNEGRNSLSLPANCSGVISVVASQSLGDRASYSNYGEGANVSAPGGEFAIGSLESPDSQGAILSAWVDNSELSTYRLSEGTSMAAPVVSGIVALMYSIKPNITPAQVRRVISKSVRPFAPESNCAILGGCGTGIINAHLALVRTNALK